MKKVFLSTVLLSSSFLFFGCASKKVEVEPVKKVKHELHWSYEGEGSPIHWASIKSEYQMCGIGKNQSPINLSDFHRVNKKQIGFKYYQGGSEIVNNGHSIQVNYNRGNFVTVEGKRYALKQFHFHTPSEHQIEGRSFPLEAHFVHQDEKGNLLVIGVMYEEGEQNPELSNLLPQVSPNIGEKRTLKPIANASALMASDLDYYRYNGSLTTPPCSEGVVWLILKKPTNASASQIEALSQMMKSPNNRPIQKINARIIEE